MQRLLPFLILVLLAVLTLGTAYGQETTTSSIIGEVLDVDVRLGGPRNNSIWQTDPGAGDAPHPRQHLEHVRPSERSAA